MNSNRIEEIQNECAYPDSISVQQALLKVWNECVQEHENKDAFEGWVCMWPNNFGSQWTFYQNRPDITTNAICKRVREI